MLQPRLANPPGPGRKRRILGYVLLPGGERPINTSLSAVIRSLASGMIEGR